MKTDNNFRLSNTIIEIPRVVNWYEPNETFDTKMLKLGVKILELQVAVNRLIDYAKRLYSVNELQNSKDH